MIIGVASSGLGHVARGIESWAADLSRALAIRGADVRLYKGGGVAQESYERVIPCTQREGRVAQSFLPFRRVLWRFGLGSAYRVEQVTFALNLLRHLRRDRVDVLHVQDPLVASIIQRAGWRGLTSTRVILAHGTEEPAAYLAKFDYVQHLAPWHLEDTREAGVWRADWRAIPNFIDVGVFSPGRSDALRTELGIPPEALIVMTAAAIKRHHKRIHYLIDEFAQLIDQPSGRPIRLVVAGGWEAETDALIAEANTRLGDKVQFLVRFPRSRMPELYRAADIFVLCSLKEMMPVALLEAMGCGKPCVVNQHPVLEWMIGPGGRSIDMGARGELARTLQELIRDDALRGQFADRARQHCVEQFGRESVVDQIVDYYELIVSANRRIPLASATRESLLS